jgi:hypothetical protein
MLPHHAADDDDGEIGRSLPGDTAMRDDDCMPGTAFGPETWQQLDEGMALLEAGLPL